MNKIVPVAVWTGLIKNSINEAIKEIIEEETKNAKDEVEERIHNMIDAIALKAFSYYNIYEAGDRLVIEVRKKEIK